MGDAQEKETPYADTNVWCGEVLDQRPRVHSCLYDWCPRVSEHCARCDACISVLREHRLEAFKIQKRHETKGDSDVGN